MNKEIETIVDAVLDRPSLRRILDDGVVSIEEIAEQCKNTQSLYEDFVKELSPGQTEKLNNIISEVGVTFAVTVLHNLKRS